MKSLFTFFVALLVAAQLQAAPGDTTWVQAHSNVQLNYYNNFDTLIKFPDGTTKYRKIIMVFTLGKYVCPGTPTYCSDWDYTVQNYLMNKNGDTLELGRLITPYGKGSRMPASWTQKYYFDVTDYAPALKDSNLIRILYSGYSGGFTADIKFAMIEGTPERTVTGLKTLWKGSYAFGSATDPIDNHLQAISMTAPTGTQSATYRFNVTGHGSDPNGCSEFCPKYYNVLKNGSVVTTKTIWRDNCGTNELYPQSGTWVYERGNWCPGALVYTNFHPIPSVTAGSNFNLSMQFEPYTSTGGASYTVFGTLVYYAGINKTLDASVEDIIAPTDYDGYFRENVRVGHPTIKIRNTGSSSISSVQFSYGVTGQPLTNWTWTGVLPALTDTILDFPFAQSFLDASGTNVPFEVNILKVNGSVDNDATNNKMTSVFNPIAAWPSTFTVILKTNSSMNGAVSETEWKLTNESGTVVAQRINNAPTTSYYDTLNLPTGVYKLSVTDAGCDGLSWWANTAGGTGSMSIKPTLFTSLALRGYFAGDFGCGFDQYFKVGNPTAIHDVNHFVDFSMNVYPNPAQQMVQIAFDGVANVKGTLYITDHMGRIVMSQSVSSTHVSIPTTALQNGLYFVRFQSVDTQVPQLQSKLLIMK